MTYEEAGGDELGTSVRAALAEDYLLAGRRAVTPDNRTVADCDDASGSWESRVLFDVVENGMSPDSAIAKHRTLWRQLLGLEPSQIEEVPIVDYNAPYQGNMCGWTIPDLPPVEGGKPGDPSLFIEWFLDRYPEDVRKEKIYPVLVGHGGTDILLSWADAEHVNPDPQHFAAVCMEAANRGLRPNVMGLSKDFSPHNDVAGCVGQINRIKDWLQRPRRCARFCVGFELGLDDWLTPRQVQEITDAVCPGFREVGIETYVHFQSGYPHLAQYPGGFNDYWNIQNNLTGLWHQRDVDWSDGEYYGRLEDVTKRFSGQNVGYVIKNGPDGVRPFKVIALEISAWTRFNFTMSEAEQTRLARIALSVNSDGPYGNVRVLGSGNG